jgi:hypothetical protein
MAYHLHTATIVYFASLLVLTVYAFIPPGPEGEGPIERLLLFLSRTIGTEARDIQKFKNGVNDLYLRRFYVTPRWLARFLERRKWWKWPTKIFLHHILRSDDDRDSHDHPWAFTSMILAGSYREKILKHWSRNGAGTWEPVIKERLATPGSILRNPPHHTHRVEIIYPVWSLVFVRGASRVWGFWTQDESTPDKEPLWVPWRKYLGIPDERDADEDVILEPASLAIGPAAINTWPNERGNRDRGIEIATEPSEEVTPVITKQTTAELLARSYEATDGRVGGDEKTHPGVSAALIAQSRAHVLAHEAARRARDAGPRIAVAIERKGE